MLIIVTTVAQQRERSRGIYIERERAREREREKENLQLLRYSSSANAVEARRKLTFADVTLTRSVMPDITVETPITWP